MYAASQGHYDIVKILISNGANLCKRNKFHDNALRVAILHNEPEIVKILKSFTGIQQSAEVGNKNQEIITADKQESNKRKGTTLTRKYSKRTQ